MRKFFKEFRDFIQKGNVLDLAVGIIIGTAFNKIVSSLVNDIIMPIVGLVGGKNIQDGRLELVPAVFDVDGNVLESAVTLNYGNFLQYIIDFLIIGLTVFVIVKVMNRVKNRAERTKKKIMKKTKGGRAEVEEIITEEVVEVVEEVVEPKPTTEDLLVEIRDLLKEEKIKSE